MSEIKLARLFDLELQESDGSPSSMSKNLSRDPQPTSRGDGDGGRIPVEEWLPITESRKGNVYTATFHLICSGLGFQLLFLPAAFATVGWLWGTIVLTVGFAWKLYTIWLLVNLHEAVQRIRISRYLRLVIASFGVRLGKLLGIFPVMYLSGGACAILVITGGKTINQLLLIMSENDTEPLTTVQCFLIFSILAVVMSQFPNMNSLFGISLVGSLMAVAYSTAVWTLPLANERNHHQNNVSYTTNDTSFKNIINAIGMIAMAFRGNNLVLEIQGTLPSDPNNPSRKTMWRAVVISHVIIAICMFLVAIVVYWAYGDKIPATGGPIGNYLKLYEQGYSKQAACFIHLTFIFYCLCSYPIFLMPSCDNAEMLYITKTQKPCSFFVRMMLRVLLGSVSLLIAVGFSFMTYLAVLIGAVGLLVTSTYPCFMWISLKNPQRKSLMWLFNVLVGSLGVSLSVLLVVGSSLRLADTDNTAVWTLPLANERNHHQNNVSYTTNDTSFKNIINAIGMIAMAFRGNNLVLEIQGTLPSDPNNPSRKTMWRAVVISHVIIAICMFLVAIVVYWAYGDKIPATGGPIGNYLKLYEQGYSKQAACFIHLTFIFYCLCSYPIFLMPSCDNAEMLYITKTQKPCSFFVRMMLRVLLGSVSLLIAVGFSFMTYLAVLIGAVGLLVTSTYPCFMWISLKNPQRKSLMWLFNVLVGSLGVSLSVLLVVGSSLRLADTGLHANFFKP